MPVHSFPTRRSSDLKVSEYVLYALLLAQPAFVRICRRVFEHLDNQSQPA
jgi:hypothetical protein